MHLEKEHHEQRASLLDEEERGNALHERQDARLRCRRWLKLTCAFLFLSLSWNVYSMYAISVSHNPDKHAYGLYDELYSPAAVAIEHEMVKFHLGFNDDTTKYQGVPTKEIDQAWADLYSFGHTRITKDEARLLTNKTAAIPGDEEHYIVELNVFHQLHCLDALRRALHEDRYVHKHPMPNGQDEFFGWEHMGHCIDSIRQSLQCSSDVTPIVWQWSELGKGNKARAEVPHSCRNFEKVKQWALDRQLVAPFDESIRIEDDIVVDPF